MLVPSQVECCLPAFMHCNRHLGSCSALQLFSSQKICTVGTLTAYTSKQLACCGMRQSCFAAAAACLTALFCVAGAADRHCRVHSETAHTASCCLPCNPRGDHRSQPASAGNALHCMSRSQLLRLHSHCQQLRWCWSSASALQVFKMNHRMLVLVSAADPCGP